MNDWYVPPSGIEIENHPVTLKFFKVFKTHLNYYSSLDGDFIVLDFQPKIDITVFELALITKLYESLSSAQCSSVSIEILANLLTETGLIRHFKKV